MEYKITEIIDFEKINQLLTSYTEATGLVSALLDLDGNILSQSGWQKICTEFHRVHPETAKNCRKSDTILAGKLQDGKKYNIYKCLNGLVDVAVPIIVNEIHIGNLFTGQFFMETPKEDLFIAQAEKYNFDKKDYMSAFSQVPIIKESEIKSKLLFLIQMTEIIAEIGLARIKQIETNKALQKSEEKYRALFNNAPDMYVSVSPDDASILLCNDTLLKETGYSREEVIGSPIFKMYHDECMADVRKSFDHFIETGEIKNKELILKRKDGSKIDVSLNVYGVKDETGKVIYSMSSWRDISERKQVEQALIENEKRFQKAQTIGGVGNWEYNLETSHFWASEEAKRIYGFEQGALKFTVEEVESCIPERERVHKTLIDLIEKDKEYNIEFDIITKNTGERKTIQSIAELEKNAEGKAVRVSGVITNITLLKEKTAELSESEERFRHAITYAPYPIMIHADGKVLQLSEEWIKQTGYTIDDIPTIKEWSLKAYVKDAVPSEEYIENLYKIDKPQYDGEWKVKIKDGNYRYWDFSSSPIGELQSGKKMVISMASDITERKLSEKSLSESEEKFKSLMQQSPFVVELYDLNGLQISVNKAYEELWDFPAETTLNKFNVLKSKEVEDTGLMEYVKLAYAGESVVVPEFIFNPTGNTEAKGLGRVRWLSTRIYPLKELSGKVTNIVIVHQDITDRKQAEQALLESTVFNETLLNTSPDIIYIYDIDENKNVYSNNGLMKILGYTINEINEMGNQIIPQLMHPDDFKIYLKDIYPQYQQLKDNELVTHEYRMKHKSGDWNWLLSKESIFLRDTTGNPIQIFGLTSDITERKQAEDEIRKYQENLEELVKERTKNLENKNKELERFNELFVDREFRIKELKEEIKELKGNKIP